MYMIEIEESKLDKMADYTEKMLRYGGKLMQCITDIDEKYGERDDEMGDSSRYGSGRMHNRYDGSYGSRYDMRSGSMNYRDDEDWDDEEMHERRGGRRRRRDSRGRYL